MKRSLLAMALATSITTAALASDQQPPGFANNAFTQTDIQALFGQDGQHAVQLASLSAQEMQDTEGAWAPVIGAAVGGIGGFSGYFFENRISGSPWSWNSAIDYTVGGAATGIGASVNPAYLVWGFNANLGRSLFRGVSQHYGK